MFFTVLTFITAFAIEGLGTLVSVIGLSTLFGANPIIIALAIALDAGKLVVVTFLYSHWRRMGVLMKSYALVAATVTMVITSAGAAGYLSGEFQKAIVGTQEGSLKVQVLKEEQAKLEARKKQIDDQIANLPSNFSRSRVTLMKQFEAEQQQVTARLSKISEELPQLQIAQISTEAKAGPILYISKAFDVPVEEAVKWVILMIIFVFDPLAVFLIIVGNYLLHQHRMKKDVSVADADLFEEPPAKLDPAASTMAATDEPGVGNSRVSFYDQMAAVPPEFRVKVRDPVDENHPKYATPEVSQVVEPSPTQDPSPPIFEVLQPTRVSPEVLPELAPIVENYPDTSQTRTYTKQDLIDLGASPETMIAAGFEPEPAPEPPAPKQEVLEDLKPREVITREQLLAQQAHFPHVSSLNTVKADDSIVFTQNPQADSSEFYQNLK